GQSYIPLYRAGADPRGGGAGPGGGVPDRGNAVALWRALPSRARPDVLRRRDLRAILPRCAAARPRLRLEHRRVGRRRPRRIIVDAAGTPAFAAGGAVVLPAVDLVAASSGRTRRSVAAQPSTLEPCPAQSDGVPIRSATRTTRAIRW